MFESKNYPFHTITIRTREASDDGIHVGEKERVLRGAAASCRSEPFHFVRARCLKLFLVQIVCGAFFVVHAASWIELGKTFISQACVCVMNFHDFRKWYTVECSRMSSCSVHLSPENLSSAHFPCRIVLRFIHLLCQLYLSLKTEEVVFCLRARGPSALSLWCCDIYGGPDPIFQKNGSQLFKKEASH